MTTEQLAELAESLSILSAKSSVIKERDELRALVDENSSSDEVLRFYASSYLQCSECSFGRILSRLQLRW